MYVAERYYNSGQLEPVDATVGTGAISLTSSASDRSPGTASPGHTSAANNNNK